MKFALIVIALLGCGYTTTTKAQSVGDVFDSLYDAFGFELSSQLWAISVNSYSDACFFTEDIIPAFAAADAMFNADPTYIQWMNILDGWNSEDQWDRFLFGLLGALGFNARTNVPGACITTGTIGVHNIIGTIGDFYALSRDNVVAALAAGRVNSPDFASFMDMVHADQATANRLQCSSEVQAIVRIYDALDTDIAFILDIMSMIFAWNDILSC